MKMIASPSIKPVVWIGSTRIDLASFPEDVKDAIGYALYVAQRGGKHPDAKPLRGFGGAGILEIVEDHAGDNYRGVYTVRLAGRIYVLHVFQKKSKRGIKTPKAESELIKSRLRRAEEEHARWLRRDSRHEQSNWRSDSRAATDPNSRRAHPKDRSTQNFAPFAR